MKPDPSPPLVIELYAGTFGWSAGWLALGGRAVGFDIEHLPHHGPIPERASLVLQDVRTLHGSQFKDADLILASPPCQEFSYRAMPWKRAKALGPPVLGMALFEACFRLQREACEAAGRHIPMVVENVRGAQKWVGRARWHFGSYYLWGDVPALMPMTIKAQKFNPDGTSHGQGSWFAIADSKERGSKGIPHRTAGHCTNPAEHDAIKNDGGSWFNVAHNTTSGHGRNPVHALQHEGVKGAGNGWFNDGKRNGTSTAVGHLSRSGSKSSARKAASALIAQIPERLSDWIAECYYPTARPG